MGKDHRGEHGPPSPALSGCLGPPGCATDQGPGTGQQGSAYRERAIKRSVHHHRGGISAQRLSTGSNGHRGRLDHWGGCIGHHHHQGGGDDDDASSTGSAKLGDFRPRHKPTSRSTPNPLPGGVCWEAGECECEGHGHYLCKGRAKPATPGAAETYSVLTWQNGAQSAVSAIIHDTDVAIHGGGLNAVRLCIAPISHHRTTTQMSRFEQTTLNAVRLCICCQ
jgi:hypothetical protein